MNWFTNSQSPTRRLGTMLADGIRYAWTMKMRIARKMAISTASDFKPSHDRPEEGRRVSRARATLLCFGGTLRATGFLTAGIGNDAYAPGSAAMLNGIAGALRSRNCDERRLQPKISR